MGGTCNHSNISLFTTGNTSLIASLGRESIFRCSFNVFNFSIVFIVLIADGGAYFCQVSSCIFPPPQRPQCVCGVGVGMTCVGSENERGESGAVCN